MAELFSRRELEGESYPHPKSISLDLTRSVARELIVAPSRPWEALYSLGEGISRIGPRLPYDEYDEIGDGIFIHVSAYLSPNARIEGPAIICGGARICNSVTLARCVIGAFSTVGECGYVSDSILFDRSRLISHNHISSSIIGYNTMIGAGTVVARERLDGANILFDMPEGIYVSGKKRLGAVVCDNSRIGSLCVINPGAVIAEGAQVLPLTSVTGYFPQFARDR